MRGWRLLLYVLWSRYFWRRVRIYGWTLIVSGAILFLGFSYYVLQVRLHPILAIKPILDLLPFPYHVTSVEWTGDQQIEIRGLAFGTAHPDLPSEQSKIFFQSSRVILSFSLDGLQNGRLDSLEFRGPQLFLARFESKVIAGGPSLSDQAQSFLMSQLNWVVSKVQISNGTVYLENIGPDKNLFVPIRIGAEGHPTILRDMHLNDLDAGDTGQAEQVVRVRGVTLISPFDPLSPVADLPLTEITFTYGGLWHRHLRDVTFLNATLYLGADLFWFADGFKSHPASTLQAASGKVIPKVADQPDLPWTIDHVFVRYGSLGVSAFGQTPVTFPFDLEAEADNIKTNDMTNLTMKTAIAIRRFDKEYPAYKVKIVDLHGLLQFNLPPGTSFVENAVQTLQVDELSWNGIAVTDSKATLIFDRNGVFGHLEGNCYTGKLQGDFGITYNEGFPWLIRLKADKVDVEPITERLAPNYLVITGKATGNLFVEGKTIDILNSEGLLKMEDPGGLMKITSLETLLKQYPIVGNQIKQAAAEYLVNALKNYPYNQGQITLHYTPAEGDGILYLNGPRGVRNFQVHFHPYADPGVKTASTNVTVKPTKE